MFVSVFGSLCVLFVTVCFCVLLCALPHLCVCVCVCLGLCLCLSVWVCVSLCVYVVCACLCLASICVSVFVSKWVLFVFLCVCCVPCVYLHVFVLNLCLCVRACVHVQWLCASCNSMRFQLGYIYNEGGVTHTALRSQGISLPPHQGCSEVQALVSEGTIDFPCCSPRCSPVVRLLTRAVKCPVSQIMNWIAMKQT